MSIKKEIKQKAKTKAIKKVKNIASDKKASESNKPGKKGLLMSVISAIIVAIAGFFVYDQVINLENSGDMLVHFIDVGQGDAVLIQTSQGSVLIDGGDNSAGPILLDYLHRVGITELTYIVATHPHADHIGGLIPVINNFPVGTVVMPDATHTTVTFERFITAIEENDVDVQEAIVGDTFYIESNTHRALFYIIAPNYAFTSLNDLSVGLRVEFGDRSLIFTGDAEEDGEMAIVNAGHNIYSDVLHVGHHGSRTSTIPEFLEAVSPTIAVINVGRNNRYGHPHEPVLDRLNEIGATIFRTDIQGHIILSTDGVSISVDYEGVN